MGVRVHLKLCSLQDPALFVGRRIRTFGLKPSSPSEMRDREWIHLTCQFEGTLKRLSTIPCLWRCNLVESTDGSWRASPASSPPQKPRPTKLFHLLVSNARLFVNCNVISHRFQMDQRVRQLCGGKLWLLALTILNVPWKMRLPAVRRRGRWKTACQVNTCAVGFASTSLLLWGNIRQPDFQIFSK